MTIDVDILTALVFSLVQVSTLLLNFLNGLMDVSLFTISLNFEGFLGNMGIFFQSAQKVIYLFALYLIILKFVKKVLDVYALQVDGDPNMDIQVLLTNFFKAMVIAMSFTTIWSWLLDIVVDFGEKLVKAVNTFSAAEQIKTLSDLDTGSVDVGSPTTVLIPVFLFLALIMWFVLLKNGMEFWIVRLGVPLACCGLLDSDQGMFKQYTKIILKEILTILIRIFMLHVALAIMSAEVAGGSNVNMVKMLIAFVAIIVAFSTPKMLSELLIQNGGGGSKLMTAVYMGSTIIRGVI